MARESLALKYALLSIALFPPLVCGCAGPSTPLGAPWATTASATRNGPFAFFASLFRVRTSQIRFEPQHQVLHGPSPLRVLITDDSGIRENYRLIVRHNGLDVTPSFLRQAAIDVRAKEIDIKVPVLRLSANTDHLIEVVYGGNSVELGAYARLEPPVCHAFAQGRTLTKTSGYAPSNGLVGLINSVSERRGFNPAFTAALIAQESSFNPRTVSWAKAIGLTQVTPVAEDEIVAHRTDWPRYPGINEMPTLFVKALVLSGRVNNTNEWRLDNSKSIHGGLAYAHTLGDRWTSPENMTQIATHFKDTDLALTQLILASYHSGYGRVSAALNRYGASWMSAPELKEARYYVNRILSLCDSFITQGEKGEITNEEQT